LWQPDGQLLGQRVGALDQAAQHDHWSLRRLCKRRDYKRTCGAQNVLIGDAIACLHLLQQLLEGSALAQERN